MRICGVVAEYNPFHNGHRLQLREARRLSGCDFLAVVMAGAFSQRGEPCLTDKWTRARMALTEGADLVVELPALFAVRSADWFARGGVETLCALGADCISFGCETDDAQLLTRIADAAEAEDPPLREAIRSGLSEGKTLARARGEALEGRLGLPEGFLDQPNLALALEYLRAARGRMVPIPVLRRGAYHDDALSPLASASAIRQVLLAGGDASIALPDSCAELLKHACLARPEALDRPLLYALRGMSQEAASALWDAGEGLDRRLVKAAAVTGTREALIGAVKCKRYTYARISRLCAAALLGLTKELAAAHPQPEYIRVLGFSRAAAPLLSHIKEHSALPLVTDPMRLMDNALFSFERRATDLQSLCMEDPACRAAGRDLTERMPVV